jgi:hypothetical protein
MDEIYDALAFFNPLDQGMSLIGWLDQAFAHCQRFFTAAAKAGGPCFSPAVTFPPLRIVPDQGLGPPLPSQLPNPHGCPPPRTLP